jgi:PTS system mannose-specific IIA component
MTGAPRNAGRKPAAEPKGKSRRPAAATKAGIGLVLVAHGNLAEAFVTALEHIVGSQGNLVAIPIQPDDDVEERRAEILAAIERVDSGAGAVVMTDMFGGTPSNLALSALGVEGVEVIAGVNLPMLIKFASMSDCGDLSLVVAEVQAAGRKYINVASKMLAGDR